MTRRFGPAILLSLMVSCNGGKDDTGDPANIDADGDGFNATVDCDDNDPTVYPGADEIWYDGIDQNCDGWSDYDADMDGYDCDQYGGNDCDDADPDINPAAEEIPYDGIDQNCNGMDDDDDLDLDGYPIAEDCDDTDPNVYPGAEEIWYDGIDQNCDGWSDYDADMDGYDCDQHGGLDCDDTDPAVYPGADEIWYDGIDQDCRGGDDFDADGDGYQCAPGVSEGCPETSMGTDCDDFNPNVWPGAAEVLDGADNNCDGSADRWSVEDAPGGVIYGLSNGDGFGSVMATGDLDGDGLPDLLVGSTADDGLTAGGTGAIWFFPGSDLDSTPTTAASALGYLVTSNVTNTVGAISLGADMDGDGLAELVVGHPYGRTGPSSPGAVAIYLASDIMDSFDLAEPVAPGQASTYLSGSESGSLFGTSLVWLLDEVDDNLPELAVGAPGHGDGGAVVLFDSTELLGLGTVAPGTLGVTLTGDEDDLAGTSLATIGDLDGDGLGDLLIGCPGYDDGAGMVQVVLGAGALESATISSVAHATFTGISAGDALGTSVTVVGDLNGDGLPEVAIGAPGQTSRYGMVHVVDGADVAAGGTWSVADSALVSYLGSTYMGHAGAGVEAGLDVDGDGLSDLMVAGPGNSTLATDGGTLYLVLAGRTGARALVDADAVISGAGPSDMLGSSMIGADFNGDGLDDLVFGVPGEDYVEADEGAAYIVFSAW